MAWNLDLAISVFLRALGSSVAAEGERSCGGTAGCVWRAACEMYARRNDVSVRVQLMRGCWLYGSRDLPEVVFSGD
jgi:hypothetical protein